METYHHKKPNLSSMARLLATITIRKRISGKDNALKYKGSLLRAVNFDIKGNRNRIEIQEGCRLEGVLFHLRGDDHHILIEKGCRFNRGGSLWLEDHHCELLIGAGSSFEAVHIAVTEPGSRVEIGEDCMFAYDIDIRTGDSHSILDRKNRKRINRAKDVCIKDHVWVAAHSIILKGVTIMDDSIVATGSVVTKGYNEKSIILAGNPARPIKRNITWTRQRTLSTEKDKAK